MDCTIYKDIYSFETPHRISIDKCLERIKTGRSRQAVERLRAETNEDLQNEMKKNLPSVVFSGVFSARRDSSVQEYSNFMILDFDDVENIAQKRQELAKNPFCYAVWTSPRGNGLKMLIRVLDGRNHKKHFKAVQQDFPEVDKSGSNISRVCFESYDPEIFINRDAEIFTKEYVEEVSRSEVSRVESDDLVIYGKLKKWMENKSESFVSGNRNNYIYKLSAACCRFGISESSALDFILRDYAVSDFSHNEIKLTLKSAYRSNQMGSAEFVNNEVVTTTTGRMVDVKELGESYEEFSHIIFGESVKNNFLEIYRNGYEKLSGINCPAFDNFFKLKRRELTLFSGYGNMGKSTFLQWVLLNRAILYGEKFALYSPESNPAEEFYLEFVEMLAGGSITPSNVSRPDEREIMNMYDFVSRHFFYVYPEKVRPSVTNIKESFLEMIIKHKVDGVVIDPFNQIFHDRSGITREDFYLEETLSDFTRFASDNDVFFLIVAHPTRQVEKNGKDFTSPDMYKISGGAMWANKMHNILIYHRPKSRSEPENPLFELTTEKIKKKKIVGKGGTMEGFYQLKNRRFIMPYWDSITKSCDLEMAYDPLKENILKMKLFSHKEEGFKIQPATPEQAFGDAVNTYVEDKWAEDFPF